MLLFYGQMNIMKYNTAFTVMHFEIESAPVICVIVNQR
jgi:hypothetical protein